MEEKRENFAPRSKKPKSGGFLAQGSIYAASGVISSLIGLVYRMPLTRIIGDEGNGYYAAAFNIYAIVLLLSSYSLPLAVSKLISARVGAKNYRNAERILHAALLYATVVGGIGFTAIFFGADRLRFSIRRKPRTRSVPWLRPSGLCLTSAYAAGTGRGSQPWCRPQSPRLSSRF